MGFIISEVTKQIEEKKHKIDLMSAEHRGALNLTFYSSGLVLLWTDTIDPLIDQLNKSFRYYARSIIAQGTWEPKGLAS